MKKRSSIEVTPFEIEQDEKKHRTAETKNEA